MVIPTQLAFRTQKYIGVLNGAPVYESLPGFNRPEGNLRCCCYSPDGRFFAWATPEQVFVIDASIGHIVATLPALNVYELGFSPLGTYIITWQRPGKDEQGNAVKNLKVWITIDSNEQIGQRAVVGQFVQRSQTGWNLQYTSDEQYCARVVTNEVQFYESNNLRQVWNKLIIEGVADFSLSSSSTPSVAAFVPERKGQPAVVKLYHVPKFTAPIAQKTFFKGDKVQMMWNKNGTGLLVLAQTDVDKSNKSYYGESTMFLLTTTGFDSRITLDKEGPIHDVAWSPNSKEFGVVYGFMPAKTTIFNSKADATHSFALGPRNTIAFSPHGRYVLVAGFGNLAGQVDIYDLTRNFSKISTLEASNASICEWSPDGTHILFATTSPRLRVDNGIRVFHVGGPLMYNEEMHELYHVCWRPQSSELHPIADDPLTLIPEPHESAKAVLAKVKPATKPAGAYRPPGARGMATPLAFKREDEGGAAFISNGAGSGGSLANGFGKSRRRDMIPGAEAVEGVPIGAAPGGGVYLGADGDEGLSKAALKNKKKREAKKAKEAAEKEKGLGTETGVEGAPTGPRALSHSPHRHNNNHRRNKSGYEQIPHHGRSTRGPGNPRHERGGYERGQPVKNIGALAPVETNNAPYIDTNAVTQLTNSTLPPDLTVTSPGDSSNPNEKKVRSLHKKLRAIEELKMRQAGGEKLEATQIMKIGTEESVRKDLDALGPSAG